MSLSTKSVVINKKFLQRVN